MSTKDVGHLVVVLALLRCSLLADGVHMNLDGPGGSEVLNVTKHRDLLDAVDMELQSPHGLLIELNHSWESAPRLAPEEEDPNGSAKTAGLNATTYADAIKERFYATFQMRFNLALAFVFVLAIVAFEVSHKNLSNVDFSQPFASLEEGREERSHDSVGPLRGALVLWTAYIAENKHVFTVCAAQIVLLLVFFQYANTLLVNWSNEFWANVQKWGGNKRGSAQELDAYLLQFLFFAFLLIFAAAYKAYLMSLFQIHVRETMTNSFTEEWLNRSAYYRLELYRNGQSGTDADNPDQRIQEDIDSFINGSTTLLTGGMSSFAQFLLFSHAVYNYSPTYVMGWEGVRCPGWLLWVSIIYASFATLTIHVVARRLEILSYVMQRTEADFRWELSSVRRYAGEIALSHSESAHQARISDRFEMIRRCFWETMIVKKRYSIVSMAFFQFEVVFAFVFLGPSFLKGDIDLGVLMAASRSMGLVSESLMWFASSYGEIVSWRASTDRLVRFEEAVARRTKDGSGIKLWSTDEGDACIKCEKLKVWAPSASALLSPREPADEGECALLFRDLKLDIDPGQRVVLAGPSGAGKSSLMRALAGVWPFAEGEVRLPEGEGRALFFPADVFAPAGPLRDVVTYPMTSKAGSSDIDIAIQEALRSVGLGQLLEEKDGLDCVHDWGMKLSSGQKSRLSFARMVLHKPRFAAFDEPLAHLEESAHAAILKTAFDALPSEASVLVISHQLSPAVMKLFTIRYDVDMQGKTLVKS